MPDNDKKPTPRPVTPRPTTPTRPVTTTPTRPTTTTSPQRTVTPASRPTTTATTPVRPTTTARPTTTVTRPTTTTAPTRPTPTAARTTPAAPTKTVTPAAKAEPVVKEERPARSEAKEVKPVAQEKRPVKKETKAASAAKGGKNKAKGDKVRASGGAAVKERGLSKKAIILIAVIVVAVAAAIVVTVLLLSCKKTVIEEFRPKYATTARHGYYSETVGNVDRQTPVVSDGGLAFGYPVYGRTLSLTAEQKSAVLAEAVSLCAKATTNTGGSYDKMDKDGYLYLADGTPVMDGSVHRKLYKHTAAAGMYGGDVADSEPAVIKKIWLSPRAHSNSYSVTGLYAPAGEVITVTLSEEDFNASGGLVIHIGQALYNGQNNNIWPAKNFCRMPVILNTMNFNAATAEYDEESHTYTCYVGSYLGGPIYIRNTKARVCVTVSGAVNYRHFVLGYTTEDEFEKLSASTAPYFDLEVWDNGVLQSGPLSYVKKFSYEDLFKVATLWEKISLTSSQVRAQGVVSLYDPFVAAGAAVAFPGRSSVNNPAGWMPNALNYDTLTTSGAWGVMHEYNHNFQGWGLPDGGEVTNNALNIAEYSQYTKISAARTLGASGEGGLSGWNAYTSATMALNKVLAGAYTGTDQLSIYATLIHNIGAKAFVDCAKTSGTTNYFNKVSAVTGYDPTYFFKELTGYDPGDEAVAAASGKPMLVPVASVFQTGRSVIAPNGGKAYIETMRPYVIGFGEKFTIDLTAYTVENGFYKSGSIVVPSGISYTVKGVSAPDSGTLEKVSDKIYTYTPGDKMRSGKMTVTLGLKKDDGAFEIDDVDLVLEFEQTHEKDKSVIERTVYTYESNIFESAKEAYDSGYAGYVDKVEQPNINTVQNGNAEIWAPNPSDKAVMEIRGKLFVPTDGDYRIALRGRHSCALYLSSDGASYEFAAELNHKTNANGWHLGDEGSYKDLTGLKSGDWVYFKGVLLVDYAQAFIGLGWGRFEPVNGTINENGEFVDANGNILDENAPPAVTLAYATAYKNSYEFPTDEFVSEYLYERRLTYSYDGSDYFDDKGELVEIKGYAPWSGYSAEAAELFDDNDKNYIHSNKGVANDISLDHPFELTVDLGKELRVNTVTVYGEPSRLYLPKNFTVYGGTSESALSELVTVENAEIVNSNVSASFEPATIRYYKIVCTATTTDNRAAGEKYIAFRTIKFSMGLKASGGTHIVPDRLKYFGDWKIEHAISTAGRVYAGQKGATAEYTFTGTRFAVMCVNAAKDGLEVYIDGQKSENIANVKDASAAQVAFLSDALSDGEHSVKIVCEKTANIDSVIVW